MTSSQPMTVTRTKLIEVSLPLDDINKASAREKSIRHGHPSTLHLWWARRPLAAARAVIFGQMVDDPSSVPEEFPTPEAQAAERERLFGIVRELVKWENTTNETVLDRARAEIRRSWRRACADNAEHPRAAELFDPEKLPPFHDPFAGGGALPLEAQRLGFEAHASDLNPVAVLINKAMIEIPPKFAGRPPVNPKDRAGVAGTGAWPGATGLAADVRYYGRWMRDEAAKRIGHLYPPVEVTGEMASGRPDLAPYVGRELTVIAWLWARTVRSPNPAFADVEVPLVSSFVLSSKKGREAWVEPVIEGRSYRFEVRVGKPPEEARKGTKLSRGSNFRCLMSGSPIAPDHVKSEGMAKRMGARLMAVVAEGDRGRVYVDPASACLMSAVADWRPNQDLPRNPRWFSPPDYGMPTYADLFTERQLVALTTFSDLVSEVRASVVADAPAAKLPDDHHSLVEGGLGARAYAEAVGVYLGLASSRAADAWSVISSWRQGVEATRGTFARQALPMVWDFAEANPFSGSSGNWTGACTSWVVKSLMTLPATGNATAEQLDATAFGNGPRQTSAALFSTDPPYYDNIGYADLSDFFYVWLRRSLRSTLPALFATVAVPKANELIASPYRHGNRDAAERFFLEGMQRALAQVAARARPDHPVTIYYAFKQAEVDRNGGTTSTGWQTFLEAAIKAGFSISGTWPMRTERSGRSTSIGTNALASSIVLCCRVGARGKSIATRQEFLTAIRSQLPRALRLLRSANIAPVDLAQAAIGPGMAAYTRYAKVLDASGKPMTVRDALALINQILDEVLAEQEGDFDADSRWALAWFEEYGFGEGEFGRAETLTKAKNTSVAGMVDAGILVSQAGTVRLLAPKELPADWDPRTDTRLTSWEMVHHLIRVLETDGEEGAAGIVRMLGGAAETARELCYRLYALADRKGWAAEALAYNTLVRSWPVIAERARSMDVTQADLLDSPTSRA